MLESRLDLRGVAVESAEAVELSELVEDLRTNVLALEAVDEEEEEEVEEEEDDEEEEEEEIGEEPEPPAAESSAAPAVICFLAWPNSTLRHRVAKFNEHSVSPTLYTAGLIFTNINTLELPPRES